MLFRCGERNRQAPHREDLSDDVISKCWCSLLLLLLLIEYSLSFFSTVIGMRDRAKPDSVTVVVVVEELLSLGFFGICSGLTVPPPNSKEPWVRTEDDSAPLLRERCSRREVVVCLRVALRAELRAEADREADETEVTSEASDASLRGAGGGVRVSEIELRWAGGEEEASGVE